jgi:hypothetical protein
MIEFTTAKEGERIFKWSGRLLCSSVAPQKEAKKWLENNKERIQKYHHVVIMGLGNGFHILETLHNFRNKKLYVINFCPEILVPALSMIGNREGQIVIVSASDVEDLKRNEKFRAILQHPFSIVDFPQAMGFDVDLYAKAKEILLGRTQESLSFYAKARAHFGSSFMFNELKEIKAQSGVQLVDINQMKRQAKWDQMSAIDSCVIHALGELTK